MKVIYNSQLVDADDLMVSIQDRALNYGDGLFESLVIRNGEVSFLNRHIKRLISGCRALSISLPANLNSGYIEAATEKLKKANSQIAFDRLRLQVWRKSGGLYGPTSNSANFMLRPVNQVLPKYPIASAGIAQKIRIAPSPYSSFKTCNALPYVVASIEKQNRQLDELIILNSQGRLCECTSSNLFWIIGKQIYTPALATGCIDGIMRGVVIDAYKEIMPVMEVEEEPEVLHHSDQIFCTNATGVRYFRSLDEKSINSKAELPPTLMQFVM